MTDRDLALSVIAQLPEEVSMEEVTDELALVDALRLGVRQADEGRTKPHQEVKDLLGEWLSK